MQEKTKLNRPLFDGRDTLTEIIAYVAEPTDKEDRILRLKESINLSEGFALFIHYAFLEIENRKFTELLEVLPQIKYRNTGVHFGLPFQKTMLELYKYSDTHNERMPLVNRVAQFTEAMDYTVPEDCALILKLMGGNKCLPNKIHRELVKEAYPELGEALDRNTSNPSESE